MRRSCGRRPGAFAKISAMYFKSFRFCYGFRPEMKVTYSPRCSTCVKDKMVPGVGVEPT